MGVRPHQGPWLLLGRWGGTPEGGAPGLAEGWPLPPPQGPAGIGPQPGDRQGSRAPVVGGCREAGGGKSETGAVLSGRAQVWPDKFIKRCRLPTVSAEQAGGLWGEDAPGPIGPSKCYQRPGGPETGSKGEVGRWAAGVGGGGWFQAPHPNDQRQGDKASEIPGGPLTPQPHQRLHWGSAQEGQGFQPTAPG